MNIVVISHGASGGGSERVASILANYLVKSNNVHFYAIHSAEKEYYLDERLIYFYGGVEGKNKLIRYVKRTLMLRKYVKENEINAVISFIYGEGFAIYKNKNVKKIFSLRNDPNQESKFSLWIMKKLYKDADAVVFQTEDAKSFFDESISKHGVVIPNPIKPGLPKWNVNCKKEIIAAGRLHSQKNFPMLLRAFALFSKTHEDYSLTICGSGNLLEQLKQLAYELNIDNKVVFAGHVTDIHDRMKESAIYVSSSDYEGISNSMLEAMAIGIPAVCTDCPIGGAKMFIKNGVNGYLVPVGDDLKLAERLNYMADNFETMSNISLEAQKLRELLNEEKICAQWSELL